MSPPLYADLAKRAKDVFNKCYIFGLMKVGYHSKTDAEIELDSGGESKMEDGSVYGSFVCKYKVKEYGLTFAEKWDTENIIGTEVSMQDWLAQGLTLGIGSTFGPVSNVVTSSFKCIYLHDYFALKLGGDLDKEASKVLNASLVVGYENFLAGAETIFNADETKITNTDVTVGFVSSDFDIFLNAALQDEGNKFGGSLFYQLSQRIQGGVQGVWADSMDNENTEISVGLKFDPDQEASICAKLNHKLQFGVGYQQKLREGITIIMSCLIDWQDDAGHKIGLGLNFDAL